MNIITLYHDFKYKISCMLYVTNMKYLPNMLHEDTYITILFILTHFFFLLVFDSVNVR